MRVAALYDVHGNLPALDAVLAELPDDATIISGGDVFSGPMPAETLARLRDLGPRVSFVRGNADRDLGPYDERWRARYEWLLAQLTPEERFRWLVDLLALCYELATPEVRASWHEHKASRR